MCMVPMYRRIGVTVRFMKLSTCTDVVSFLLEPYIMHLEQISEQKNSTQLNKFNNSTKFKYFVIDAQLI